MEESVETPVRRIDAPAQIVPAVDRVHRLVADDFLQCGRRHRPVDTPQHQETAVEPGRQKVLEIAVDRFEIGMVAQAGKQVLAHRHQRRSAAGRAVQPADQFLPARFGRGMKPGRGDFAGIAHIGLRGLFQRRLIGAEFRRQGAEERRPASRIERRIGIEKIARQRHAGRFAAA